MSRLAPHWLAVAAGTGVLLTGAPAAAGPPTAPEVPGSRPVGCPWTGSPADPDRLLSAASLQTPARLSLAAALEEAEKRRPVLAAEQERISATQARVTQSRAGLLPRVEIQASATDGPLGAPALMLGGLVGTPIKSHTGGSLNFVQTLLDFGRTHNLVRARRADVAASQEALQSARNRVTLEVQQAYFQALQARRLIGVNRQILAQREGVARQAKVRLENGLASRVEVDLAELNVAQARLAIVRAQADAETGVAALGAAIGREVPSEVELEEPAAPDLPPASLDEVTRAALVDRPELRQATQQVRALEHLISAAKAGKRPFLFGVGSVGKVNPVPLFEAGDKPWAVGLGLTIPLFTGYLVEGQVEEARRNAGAARASLEEWILVVRRQVAGAVANLTAAEESIRVARLQLTTAEDAQNLASQRYEAQLGSIVELTQAQVAFATAQNDLVRAQYDRELARAALAFAAGRVGAERKPEGRAH